MSSRSVSSKVPNDTYTRQWISSCIISEFRCCGMFQYSDILGALKFDEGIKPHMNLVQDVLLSGYLSYTQSETFDTIYPIRFKNTKFTLLGYEIKLYCHSFGLIGRTGMNISKLMIEIIDVPDAGKLLSESKLFVSNIIGDSSDIGSVFVYVSGVGGSITEYNISNLVMVEKRGYRKVKIRPLLVSEVPEILSGVSTIEDWIGISSILSSKKI